MSYADPFERHYIEAECAEAEEEWARKAAAIEEDTGLTPDRQALRELRARAWVVRLMSLMASTGCSAVLAFKATEASNKERPHE